jgi:hypothetical protein
MSRHHLPPGTRRVVHGYQIMLFSYGVPEGWIAAGEDTFDAEAEAMRYLDQVWDPAIHTRAALLKDGRRVKDVTPIEAA